MDKYPLHRTGATGYNGTGKGTRYERSTIYPLPRSKGKEGEGEMKYEITISTTIEVEADGAKKAKEKALEYDGIVIDRKIVGIGVISEAYDTLTLDRTPQNDEVRE